MPQVSKGPYQVTEIDIHLINEVFRLIQVEIDELRGLTLNEDVTIAPHTHAPTGGSGAVDASGVSYSPFTDVSWQSGDPGDVDDALDQLASRVKVLEAVAPPPAVSGGLLISGGSVTWTGSGLIFTVSAATYRIGSTTYSSPAATLTLTAADATLDRIDLFVLNTTPVATFITGTPAADPQAPSFDPTTQLGLTFVIVRAGASTPEVAQDKIYFEGTEWTASTTVPARITIGATTNPFAGTVHITETGVTSGDQLNFNKGSDFLLLDYDNLIFQIRNKGAWAAAKSVVISWRNSGGSLIGTAVTFDVGLFGFDVANTTTYQQISIPLTAFGTAISTPVRILRFQIAGGGASLPGFDLDNVVLEGGITAITIPSNTMFWKGEWSSSASYKANEVVTYNDVGYIALINNTSVTPGSSATTWEPFSVASTTATDINLIDAELSERTHDTIFEGNGITLTEQIGGDAVRLAVDSSVVVLQTNANFVDLTDGGATTLHSHAAGSSAFTDQALYEAQLSERFSDKLFVDAGSGLTITERLGGDAVVLNLEGIDQVTSPAQLAEQIADQVFAGTGLTLTEQIGGDAVRLSVDSTVILTTTANYVDLTDGGATTLHSHAGGSADVTDQSMYPAPLSTPLWEQLLAGSNITITESALGDYITIAATGGTTDHGALTGLSDDDHSQYLLASDATSRAAFASNWTDLTDAGATTLHSHAGASANTDQALEQAQLSTRLWEHILPSTNVTITVADNSDAIFISAESATPGGGAPLHPFFTLT